MTTRSLNTAASPIEPPLRYFFARRYIGVSCLSDYVRALFGGALWFGLPPLLLRTLARRKLDHYFYCSQRWWAAQVIRALGVHLEIKGLEHIRDAGPYIITPLHESLIDPLAMFALPLPLRFAMRDEFYQWQIVGPYVRDTGQIAIRPETGVRSYRQMLRAAKPVFAENESLVIFPQGTILGIETDFMSGAFALAHALKRPILPVALTGGHRVWEHPYTPRLRFNQQMSMRVLPPIPAADVASHTPEQLRQSVQRQIKTAALSVGMAAPRRYEPARDGYWDGFSFAIDPHFAELAADVACHRASVEAMRP